MQGEKHLDVTNKIDDLFSSANELSTTETSSAKSQPTLKIAIEQLNKLWLRSDEQYTQLLVFKIIFPDTYIAKKITIKENKLCY